MLLKGNSVLNDRKKAFITAGDASFKKMGTVKTKFVQDLLEIGGGAILTDDDVTCLRPLIRARTLETGSYAVAAARVHGLHRRPADKADDNGSPRQLQHWRAALPPHGGFQGVRRTPPEIQSRAPTIAWMRDQPAFNLLTHEGVGGHSLTPALRFKDASKKGRRGTGWCTTPPTRRCGLGVLPNWLFGSGHTPPQQHHARHPEDGASACT